jgi:hypothetical protein
LIDSDLATHARSHHTPIRRLQAELAIRSVPVLNFTRDHRISLLSLTCASRNPYPTKKVQLARPPSPSFLFWFHSPDQTSSTNYHAHQLAECLSSLSLGPTLLSRPTRSCSASQHSTSTTPKTVHPSTTNRAAPVTAWCLGVLIKPALSTPLIPVTPSLEKVTKYILYVRQDQVPHI